MKSPYSLQSRMSSRSSRWACAVSSESESWSSEELSATVSSDGVCRHARSICWCMAASSAYFSCNSVLAVRESRFRKSISELRSSPFVKSCALYASVRMSSESSISVAKYGAKRKM